MFAPDFDWGAPADARVLFTTRLGGAGVAPFDSLNLSLRTGDSEEAVLENRRRVGERLPSPPKWLRQVHGTRVVCADDASPDEEADAAFTFSRGVVCAVMTADCLPVVLCAKKGGRGGGVGRGGSGGGARGVAGIGGGDFGADIFRLADEDGRGNSGADWPGDFGGLLSRRGRGPAGAVAGGGG